MSHTAKAKKHKLSINYQQQSEMNVGLAIGHRLDLYGVMGGHGIAAFVKVDVDLLVLHHL